MEKYDVIIVGAGAAGLFCAGVAGQLGRRVLLLDHAEILGEKIRISGGGRCNFTNLHASPKHFLSMNPHFVKGPLARYTSQHFINLVQEYGIAFHEKHQGQLFCDGSAKAITELLLKECQIGHVELRHPITVQAISQHESSWLVNTLQGDFLGSNLVIATGGLPVPAIGASDFALQFAKQQNIPIVDPRPALVPLAFTSGIFSSMEEFAGLSVTVEISAGSVKKHYGQGHFREDLLITHKGLSGPAVLQASSYWREGETLQIVWFDASKWREICDADANRVRTVDNLLTEFFPARLAREFARQLGLLDKKWAEVSSKNKAALLDLLARWSVKPAGTLGWNKAEVMAGGVDTTALDSRTMMVKSQPRLFFIGECVDVTGHLGGHNFQWAWSSAYVCAHGLL